MSARRRERGDGAVYYDEARKLWVGEIDLGGVNARGRRDRKRVTARTKPAALAKLRGIQAKLDAGLPIVNETLTVRRWCEQYATTAAPEKSADDYARILATYVYPYPVARRPLAKLEPADVRQWLKQLHAKRSTHTGELLSAGTIAKARNVLSAALTVAAYDGKVARNVVQLTRAPKQKPRTSDALTAEQVDTVLAESAAGIPTYRPGTGVLSGERRPDRYYALAALVLAVGLRQAEALDLRWEAVDLDAATLEVVDAKTPAGFRTIPIPAFVVEALREHRTVQTLDRMVADAWEDDGLVFTTTIGSRIDARNALRWWHGLTTRAGVGRRRFHCSRHTAGTVMLNRGVPLVIVSQILGHARVDITAKIYARPYVETLRAGADAIDRAYSPPRR